LQLIRDSGRVARILDRDDAVHAELAWTGDQARVSLRLDPDSGEALVVEPAEADPVFGRAHPITSLRGGVARRLTTCTPMDWRAPRRIPAIAAPGSLPPGAGTVLLDVIALLAADAGVAALRYAGPYPTPGLWRALAQSFRTDGDVAVFTADAAGRALRLAHDEIPIDFVPAPFERAWITGGEVHLRDGGVARVRTGGTTYARGGGMARLVDAPTEANAGELAAEVWIGDAPYARIAVVDATGRLVDGPHAPPPCESPVIGRRFPAEMRDALGEVVATLVTPALADAARDVLSDEDVAWADCGTVAARATPEGIEVHAALWDRLAPLGLARLAAALAEALAPIVAARAQLRLAAAIAHW
jgi:hypothetical protein